MSKLRCVFVLLSSLFWGLQAAQIPNPPRPSPRLVVVVVIDQFRYDYLTRFRGEYTGGLARLLRNGAVFTNAHLMHFPTVTAVGHATILSGATPSLSGIINNDWYDREARRSVASVRDSNTKLLGGSGAGSSPHRLLVSTVGDELKIAARGGTPKVIGISYKDRAAILTSGHMADAAYWFSNTNGNLVSSTFYFAALPQWVQQFNEKRSADRWLGAEWKTAGGQILAKLPAQAGTRYYDAMERSPYGTDLLLSFAQRAIEAEGLGTRTCTDLLAISLSSTDVVGHTFGPDSPQIHDLNLNTDRQLGAFFQYLDKRFRPGSILFVLTADHGVSPLAEVQAQRRMPGGRVTDAALRKPVEAALNSRFGSDKWVLSVSSGSFWLNREAIQQKKLDAAEVERCAAEALAAQAHVMRAYTRTQLTLGQAGDDLIGRRVANGFFPSRSADVIGVLEPYWIYGTSEASHGTPYSYDTHLPLIFMGPGLKPGYYDMPVAINDIAPTLATMLEIETPSGSSGRVLHEMLAPLAPAAAPRSPAPPPVKK